MQVQKVHSGCAEILLSDFFMLLTRVGKIRFNKLPWRGFGHAHEFPARLYQGLTCAWWLFPRCYWFFPRRMPKVMASGGRLTVPTSSAAWRGQLKKLWRATWTSNRTWSSLIAGRGPWMLRPSAGQWSLHLETLSLILLADPIIQ